MSNLVYMVGLIGVKHYETAARNTVFQSEKYTPFHQARQQGLANSTTLVIAPAVSATTG